MTIKELVLNEMPSDLSDLGKARYIYLKLGNLVSFSTKFNNTTEVASNDMRVKNIDINKFNQNQVNCVIWSELYKALLDEVGIKCEIINQGHKHVEFYINDKRWVADATHDSYTDLARIHNDDETVHFGVALFQNNKHGNYVNFNDKDMNLIRQIDDRLWYNIINDDKLSDLKKFIIQAKEGKIDFDSILGKNVTFLEKIEYLFCKLGILNHGYYESKDFVYYLEQIIFNNDELKNVKAVELKRTNPNKEVDIVQCICVFQDNKYHYYLLSPNNPIEKVDKDRIIKLSLLGYGLEKNKVIPDINYPKVFKKGKICNYKLFRTYKKNKVIKYGLEAYDEEQFKKIM